MKIESGKRVRVKIKLETSEGEPIEKSVVEYFHGSGTMLTGVEEALEGLEPGAHKSGLIPPDKAFGNEEKLPTKKIARSEFPKDAAFEIGMQFSAKGADGQDVILRVVAVEDEFIDVRFLSPLCDKEIRYEVAVLDVTDPTPPPLPADAVAVEDS